MGRYIVWEGRSLSRQEVTVLSVCLSVGRSVGQSVSRNQSVRKEEKNVF